jgi:tetratricopeptide (TPR) repeat protein
MSDRKRSDLKSAIDVAVEAIDDEAAWDKVEALAAELDSPDEVLAAYKRVLSGTMEADRAEALGRRGVRFHEEWFGQDPAGLSVLLGRVVELAPRSDWAFQQLTVVLTVAERWDDLLGLYDKQLAGTKDKSRQEKLLDEAYQIAKDLAANSAKAVKYLHRLYGITRDAKQATALERLLEKHESWRELISFWEQRIEHVPPAERPLVRLRIARTWFDNLDDPGRALETLRLLLAEPGREAADQGASELLERLATAPQAAPAIREGALDLLRGHHEAAGRADDIVRVMEAALPLADLERQIALHRDAAQRLAELGKHDAAIEHYATLLRLDPTSLSAQRALRQLAQSSDRLDRYADAAADAAERATDPARKVALLTDAARARLDLDDDSGAIDLFKQALAEPGIPRGDVLSVARRLDELLARGGRNEERLPVLEKLAAAESVPSSQRALIGDVARLAEELGDADRALAAWRRRLDNDPGDMAALGAVIDLLEKEERWPELVTALEQRLDRITRAGQKRTDLIRVARIYERELSDPERAIAAWNRIKDETDGQVRAPDVVAALTALYTSTGKWRELGSLLEEASGQESLQLIDQLVRLGDANRLHLGSPEAALGFYQRALDIDSRHPGARAGLVPLLEVPAARTGAAEALGRAYRAAEDWPSYLALVDARLAGAGDAEEKLRVLREAAAIHERIGDPDAALAALARAFPLAPKDRALADQLIRLAKAQGRFDEALEGFRNAALALKDDAHAAALLRGREGELLEELNDLPGAHTAYFAVLAVDPGNLPATQAVVRIGSRLGRWVEVAAAICDCIRTRGRIEESLLNEIDEAAGETNTYDEMCRVLSAAVDQGGLEPHLAAEMHVRIAHWHRDRRAAPASAELSLRRAVACDATRLDALRELVALQEQDPGKNLYETLQRLADADPRDLDVVHRASELAVDTLGDRGLAKSSLNTLLGRATAAWRGTAPARGKLPPSDYVAWAVDRLVDLHVQSQEANAALDLLVDASRLPFDAETRLALRHRAAGVAEEVLKDEAGAIEMYRGILGQKPDDTEAIDRLAELYRKQDRTAELLALRRHELSLPLEPDRRLALRLQLVSLIDDIDRRGGRLELLRANLSDSAGHQASIDSISELLGNAGRHKELADLLAEQSRRLDMTEHGEPAARLWAQVAQISEKQLADPDRAIQAHRRVIALAPTQESLDALARLYMERGEPAEAVPWLERALNGAAGLQAATDPTRRSELSLRLARAHTGAHRPDRAITCLERAVEGGAGTREVRQMLADLYRQAERWEPLARLLTDSLPVVTDEETASAWARESAEIFHSRLGAPELARPALERALSQLPEDRSLRAMMAASLRASGETARAREMLEALIADFGRRRSKERAVVHVELALVERAEGNLDKAVVELEQASQMDVGNPANLRLLAQLARESDKLDQAERSLRALLLVVRRQPPGDDPEAAGLSEVLYELHTIAKERGDDEKASELLESALESARQSDVEVQRFRRALVAHKAGEVLLKVVESRLAIAEEAHRAASGGELSAAEAASRVKLLSIAAEAEEMMDRPGQALERLIQAMELEPGRMDLHARARELARRADALGRYLEVASAELDKMRRREDAPRVAELAMELGKLAEDASNFERARDLYRVAHRSSDSPADALFALSRVYGALGDLEAQTSALDEVAALTGDDEPSPQKADALYRLAQVQADQPEMVRRSMELLERGMRIEIRHDQAATILKRAANASPGDNEVLDLYERVARGAGDPEMLLDYLERRIARDGAQEDQVREAVGIATVLGEEDRAEAMLKSAVKNAREGLGVASGAAWAATALAERCLARGELDEARELLFEIADVAPADQMNALGLDLARRAVAANRPSLAADTYEALRQRDPSNRAVWEPLFDLQRTLNDESALNMLVSQTLPTLLDAQERNALRLRYAGYLVDEGRPREATEILRDALLDEPDNIEAMSKLEGVLVESGDDEALADFLAQRMEVARESGNADSITHLALRLGALVERIGNGDPAQVYREALGAAPDRRELLRALVATIPQDDDDDERAALIEKLIAVETPEQGAPLALELSSLWDRRGDSDRAFRALELGHKTSPDDVEIRNRLESTFRESQMWGRLAELLIAEGERASDHTRALERLREAAQLYRERLSDIRRAAEVLERARSLAPHDTQLVIEEATCLAAANQIDRAIAVLGEQLSNGISGAARIDLLLLRADLTAGAGREDDALADLEQAYTAEPDRTGQLLREALERRRENARRRGDMPTERSATMRLARLLADAGHEVHARDLLVHWLERSAADEEALHLVLEMDAAAERWDGVVAVCARLVTIENGDAQVAAATRLADAAEKCGMVQVAQQGLEYVHQIQPQAVSIRELLRRMYESAGSFRELAGLLLADAEHASDDEIRYQCYRQAADLLVNRLGDTEAAVIPAQRARDIKPDDHETVLLVADVLIASAQIREAVELLMPAIEGHKRRSPELAALQYRMAKAAAATGDRETQLAWLKRAFDVDRKDGMIAAELAQLATELGDYELALKPLRAITLNDSPGPVTRVMALLWEAKIEHARGNKAKAELWAKKALREDPTFAEAEEFLTQLAEAP